MFKKQLLLLLFIISIVAMIFVLEGCAIEMFDNASRSASAALDIMAIGWETAVRPIVEGAGLMPRPEVSA